MENERIYGGWLEDEAQTATDFPATRKENLDTGLLDQHGNKILRRPTRIKLGFDLGE